MTGKSTADGMKAVFRSPAPNASSSFCGLKFLEGYATSYDLVLMLADEGLAQGCMAL
jgi:hypothetical protein